MPLFEYKCKNKNCENSKGFEHLHIRTTDSKLTECPLCNTELKQLISAPNAHFSGSGFYHTDYKQTKQDKKERKKDKDPKTKDEPTKHLHKPVADDKS